jgi:hypothetical protein
VPAVLGLRQDPPERGWVAGEVVGDHHPGRLLLPSQHAAQEALRRLPVAPLLHQDVQHEPVAVYSAPEPVLPALDPELHLVQVPLAGCPTPAAAQPRGEGRAERAAPQPDGLVADEDPALRQQVLDVAVAEVESIVEPHGVADDLGWIAVAAGERVTGEPGRHHLSLQA